MICEKCGKAKATVHQTSKTLGRTSQGHYCEPCAGRLGIDLSGLERDGIYWIYPGERRPVVVKAETVEEAKRLVHENPQYDGFGDHVYTVAEFEKRCRDKDFKS